MRKAFTGNTSRFKKDGYQFYMVVGAAGELFSIRTKLFKPLPVMVLLDNFILSMKICNEGTGLVLEPAAFASKAPFVSRKKE